MKKIFFLLSLVLGLSSCSPKLPHYLLSYSIDYSSLTKSGYYVTESNSVNFDYEAKGSIIVVARAGWGEKEKTHYKEYDPEQDYYLGANQNKKRNYIRYTWNDLFGKAKQQLNSLNANGIINLKINVVTKYDSLFKVYYDEMILTGMAIKKL